MPNIQLDVDLSGATNLLGRLRSKLQNPAPLMDRLAQAVEDEIEASFQEERSPSGKPWDLLSPVTVRDRKRKGLVPIKTLRATEEGRKNIKVRGDRNSVTISYGGSGTGYMEVHQKGGKVNKDGNTIEIPQRQFLPERSDFERGELGRKVKGEVENYLNPSIGGFVRGEVARTPILGRVFGRG